MTHSLKTAVIGTGYLGRFHAQKYQAHANCELIAVCDQSIERAKAVAKECGCEGLDDHSSLLDNVDAVSIACTTSAHYSVAKDFLTHGVHVLLEKPMTTTVEEADELIAIAKKNKLVLQIGHLERYNNAMKAAYPVIESPHFIACQRLAPFQVRCTDVSVVLDLMIHDIDLLLSIIDSPIVNIQATGSQMLSDHIDSANARITFENGCIADLTASRVCEEPKRAMQVFQGNTCLDIDFKDKDLITHTPIDGAMNRDKQNFEANDALAEEIAEFCMHVQRSTQPKACGEAGRAALDVALRIGEAIKAHRSAYFSGQ